MHNYKEIFKSFLYWSAKFSIDQREQPFNALLMLSACETLLIVSLALFYEYAMNSLLPLSGLFLTIFSVIIFIINFYFYKYKYIDQISHTYKANVKFLAPLFAFLCICMLIVSVFVSLSRGVA